MGRRLVWHGNQHDEIDYGLSLDRLGEDSLEILEELERLGFIYHFPITNQNQYNDKEMRAWCYKNLKENWTDIDKCTVCFQNKDDAVRFRLVWG